MGTRRAATALVLLAAGTPLHAALGPRYGGELRVGIAGPAAARLLRTLSEETLLREGAAGTVEPALACSFRADEDGRAWSLQLCADRTFHDGSQVTAERAVASLRRFLEGASPAARALAASLAADEPQLEALGADHLRLRFRSPASDLQLLPLAAPDASITSARGAGAGPFVPTLTTGDDRVYTPFTGHVRGRPFVDRVRVRLFEGDAAVRAYWRRGALDLASGGEDLPLAPAVLLLALDPRSPAFASAEAREAVAAAVDREALSRLSAGAPWRCLLADTIGAADEGARPVIGAAPGRALDLVVDASLAPLVSQRIVAHLAALGHAVRVRTAAPEQVAREAADARLFLFEPALQDPALALHELATRAGLEDVPALAPTGETDPVRRRARALELEGLLRRSRVFIPLTRLSPTLRRAPALHGVASGRTPGLEDAWLEP